MWGTVTPSCAATSSNLGTGVELADFFLVVGGGGGAFPTTGPAAGGFAGGFWACNSGEQTRAETIQRTTKTIFTLRPF